LDLQVARESPQFRRRSFLVEVGLFFSVLGTRD
jgi:hypothetical protein